MPAIVIIGEQGTGKSRHAPRIAKLYGKTKIVEHDSLKFSEKGMIPLTDDMLVLTNSQEFASECKRRYNARLIDIVDAKAALSANR